jgi:hypothetical protein
MVDNRIQTTPGLKEVDQPWKEFHDMKTTNESIKQLLADGTPDWVRFPHDYKNFVREAFAAEKEISDEMAEQYHMEDQEDLSNAKARMVNPMSTKDFIRKLRANGIKCFIIDNGFPKNTVALWCIPPGSTGKARYICYMQVPAMYEWSVLKLDPWKKPVGEDYRGWRTVIVQLVEKEILTEYKAHQIFGQPSENAVFSRYRRSLWEARNKRRYTDEQLTANDV